MFRSLLACSLVGLCVTASASDASWAQIASSSGTVGYLSLGVGLSLFRDGAYAQDHALRTFDSVASAGILSELLERVTREKRPDGSDLNSLPSTHAAAVFALAGMVSRYHPKEAPLWFAGAAVIGLSRIELDKHHLHDVLAGAAIGYGISTLEVGLSHGIVIAPFVNQTDHGLEISFHRAW